MAIILELPQNIQQQLEEEWNGDLPRKIIEAVAVEGYRQGTFSRGQVSELLGLSFYETETFLKERKAYSPLTLEDLDKGRIALEGQSRYRPDLTPEERIRALDRIAERNRALPVLPPEAFERESLYAEDEAGAR